MIATPLYAGILAVMQIRLAFDVIAQRRSKRVSLGDGDGSEEYSDLRIAVRTLGNFTDYVPLALLLLAVLELSGVWQLVLHPLGIALVAGRLLHAKGLKEVAPNFTNRVRGMQLTFLVLGIQAALAIGIALWNVARRLI